MADLWKRKHAVAKAFRSARRCLSTQKVLCRLRYHAPRCFHFATLAISDTGAERWLPQDPPADDAKWPAAHVPGTASQRCVPVWQATSTRAWLWHGKLLISTLMECSQFRVAQRRLLEFGSNDTTYHMCFDEK
jgi:hypothetical protein